MRLFCSDTVFIVTVLVFFTATLLFCIAKKNKTYDLRLAPELFKQFQIHYKKNYTEKEKEEKNKTFYDNLIRINAINQNFPGNWLAVIGPYADFTYLEFIKHFKLTKENYTDVGAKHRNVINCTKRRGYLYERFSEQVKIEYDEYMQPEYYSDSEEENDATRTRAENGVLNSKFLN